MTLKPVTDVLILEKLIKGLDNGIRDKVCNEGMINTWEWICHLSDDSFFLSESLLDKNIINYFIKCYELFPNNERLLMAMSGTLCNLSDFTELRHQLMKQNLISIMLKLLSNNDHSVSYISSYMVCNILSEGNDFWNKHFENDQILVRKSVLSQLKIVISKWKIDDFCLRFSSFKPLTRLLQCNDNIPQEVHFFAVWTLTKFTYLDRKRYCRLLKEDNCITVLKNLIKCSKTEEYVRNLAKVVLYQNRLFLENGNLDKLYKLKGRKLLE